MKRNLAIALIAATWGLPALAQDYRAALEAFYQEVLLDIADEPVVLEAVRAQNAVTASYSADQIAALDRDWMAQVGSTSTPLIDQVMTNPAATYLRARQDASGGRITEVILMDAVGLNVAVSSVTSDYWQGDEAKHQQTYGLGAGSVHYSAIAMDESTGRYQGQISFTVVDPANGELLGAMTVGVDAELLQ